MEEVEHSEPFDWEREKYQRIYQEIYNTIYKQAYNEGYEQGEEEGYNKGYDHALKDHNHNERAHKKHHLTDKRWHGRPSKSWSWF